jgi:hypothetical protein
MRLKTNSETSIKTTVIARRDADRQPIEFFREKRGAKALQIPVKD